MFQIYSSMMAEDPPTPVTTTTGAVVTTAVSAGGMVASTQANTVAPTSITTSLGGPVVSTLPSQLQLQAYQVALQSAQAANGGLLSTPGAAEVQQVPIFTPGMAVLGPCNMASLAGSLPGVNLPPGLDVNSLATIVSNCFGALHVAEE